MIKSVTAVEVRVVHPVYFEGDGPINLAVFQGRGHNTPVPATKIKVTALATGDYSIRCIGKGGFGYTLHVKGSTFMVMVTASGAHTFGTVADLYKAAQEG